MSIEMNGPNSGHISDLGTNNRVASDNTARQDANSTPTNSSDYAVKDKFSLTYQAEQLKALEQEISQLPEVDTQRVERVQQALATGSFQINPAKVAEKMLGFETSLGGP